MPYKTRESAEDEDINALKAKVLEIEPSIQLGNYQQKDLGSKQGKHDLLILIL